MVQVGRKQIGVAVPVEMEKAVVEGDEVISREQSVGAERRQQVRQEFGILPQVVNRCLHHVAVPTTRLFVDSLTVSSHGFC